MRPPPLPSLLLAVAGATAGASLLGLVSLNTGAAVVAGPLALGLTGGVDEAAYQALSPPARLDVAERKARQALALSPYQNNARLRLAYIETVRHGHVTPAASALIDESYDLLPVDADVAAWRIRFALEHWSEVSVRTRQAVHAEVEVFARVGSSDTDVRPILRSISNPSGRVAAALWLNTLDAEGR